MKISKESLDDDKTNENTESQDAESSKSGNVTKNTPSFGYGSSIDIHANKNTPVVLDDRMIQRLQLLPNNPRD